MEKSKDDMDSALRRGLEKIERLRQYRALTVESEIKAARPETANRGFREQSTWWLTKQDLPKTWFSSKGNAPQVQTQSQSSPSSGPNLSSNRSHSVAVLRSCGDTDDEILSATSDPEGSEDAAKATNGSGPGPVAGSGASPRARAAAAASRAACASMPANVDRGGGGGCGSLSFRSVAAAAAAMGAVETAAAGGSGGGSGVRSNLAFERVAWALRKTRRSNSTSGAVMYDGGGDEAVPNEAAMVPIQPPKGYARYTVNLFERHRRRHSGANVSEGPNELLVSESDGDEEEVEMGEDDAEATDGDGGDASGGAAMAGLKLGTGFRALADEDVASNLQQLAVASAIAAAAARVAASNAQARGFIPGGARPNVGLIGGINPGSADDNPPLETGTLPQRRQQQKGPAPDPFVSPAKPTLATNTGREASSRNAAAHHNRAISPAPAVRASRASCVALMSSSRAGEMSSLGDSHAAAGADPPPSLQQPDGRPATAMRRRRNTVFVLSDSSSPWETPPGSPPVANRASILEHHGRLRLGSSSMRSPSVADAAAAVTVEFAAASGSVASGLPAAAAGGSGDPAAAVAAVAAASGLRARMRAKSVCARAGSAAEDNRRASIACTGTFSRCLLAPMSPSPSSQTVHNSTMADDMSVGHIGIVSPKVSRRNLLQLSSRNEEGEAAVDATCSSEALVPATQSPTGGQNERTPAGDSGGGAATVNRSSADRHVQEAELEGGDMPLSDTASTSSPPRVSKFLATAAAGSAAAAAAAAAAVARPRSASCVVAATSPTAAALLLRFHRGHMQAAGMEHGPGSSLNPAGAGATMIPIAVPTPPGAAMAAPEPASVTPTPIPNSPATQDITGVVSPTVISAANVILPATAAAAAVPALIDSPRAPTASAVTPTASSGRMYRSFTFAADDDVHGVRVRFSHVRNMQHWEGFLLRHGSRVRSASSTSSGAISMGGADVTGYALKPTMPRRLSNRRSLSYCGAVSSGGGGGLAVCGVRMGSSTGGMVVPRRGSANGIGLLDDSRP